MTEAADAGLPPPETTKPPERAGVAAIREKVEAFMVEPDAPNYQLPYTIKKHTDTSVPGQTKTTKEAVSNGITLAIHSTQKDSEGSTQVENHILTGKVGTVDAQLTVIAMADGTTGFFAVLPNAKNEPESIFDEFNEDQLRLIRNTFGIDIGQSNQ